MRGIVKINFGILKIQVRFLINENVNFPASRISTCDFSTLYNTLLHTIIKDKLTEK